MDEREWDDRYRESDLVWSLEPNQFVVEFVSDLPPGLALDVGAGEGRNAVWLAQRGWNVTAVDFSAVGMEKARRMAFEAEVELATVVADVLSYTQPEPVDLVLLAYLQLPAAEQGRVLRKSVDWLRPGGRVLVIAHDKSNVELGHGGPPDPQVCYSVDDTVAALAGLSIERAEVVERPVGDAVALDTLVMARLEPGQD